MKGGWRLGLARWLESTVPARRRGDRPQAPQSPAPAPTPVPVSVPETPETLAPAPAPAPAGRPRVDPWPKVCDRFSMRTLYLTERLRPALDDLEGTEDDPDRLQRLYRIDHAVTQIRRAARDLLVLAGGPGSESDDAGQPMPLLEVIRQAQSAIEHYDRVSVGTVTDFAVVAYAADDAASLLAALLDNATAYSPSSVTVSAHLTGDGSAVIRIDDLGIGMAPEHVAAVNAALSGPVPPVDESTGTQTGFPVVHRLAARLGARVHLASRSGVQGRAGSDTGTITMVAVPPQLLCEIPAPRLMPGPVGASGMEERHAPVAASGPSVPSPRRPTPGPGGAPAENAGLDARGLPRRQRISLREQTAPIAPAAADPLPTSADPAASRSFADDLTAFTAGAGSTGAGSAGGGPDRDHHDSWEGQVPG